MNTKRQKIDTNTVNKITHILPIVYTLILNEIIKANTYFRVQVLHNTGKGKGDLGVAAFKLSFHAFTHHYEILISLASASQKTRRDLESKLRGAVGHAKKMGMTLITYAAPYGCDVYASAITAYLLAHINLIRRPYDKKIALSMLTGRGICYGRGPSKDR